MKLGLALRYIDLTNGEFHDKLLLNWCFLTPYPPQIWWNLVQKFSLGMDFEFYNAMLGQESKLVMGVELAQASFF